MALEGLHVRRLELDQALDVVTRGHHRHGKVSSTLAHRAQQLAANLVNRCKHMLYPCAGFGDGSVARLGPLRQRLVLCTFGLNPVD